MSLGKIDPYEFSVEESLFLIDVKKVKNNICGNNKKQKKIKIKTINEKT